MERKTLKYYKISRHINKLNKNDERQSNSCSVCLRSANHSFVDSDEDLNRLQNWWNCIIFTSDVVCTKTFHWVFVALGIPATQQSLISCVSLML